MHAFYRVRLGVRLDAVALSLPQEENPAALFGNSRVLLGN